MNVKQLIERLAALPPDAPVFVADWNEDRVAPTPLDTLAVREDGSVILECPGGE